MKGNQIELTVSGRKTGKHHSRTLRKLGQVPGVLYGNKTKQTVQLATEEKALRKYSASQYENSIFKLKSDVTGIDGTPVLVKSIDVDPVTRRPLHVDFYEVDMNKAVRVSVELRFEGKAIGIAEGGLLQPIMRQIEVECLPGKIPEFISVDVTNLGIHQSVHLADVTLPEGVKAVTGNVALVTVAVIEEEAATPVAAAAAAPGAAPAAGAAAEPEVIKKGKKEEDGAAAAPAKK